MKKALMIVVCACLGAILLSAQRQPAAPTAAACAALSSLELSNATITLAKLIPAGQFAPPAGRSDAYASLPSFCRVAMTLKPSVDSDIRSEVWLPLLGWNGKFQEVGNGAWGGSIQYAALAEGLKRGYATASTDTGHTGTDASFAVGHPEKLLDFAFRAIHETALKSKDVIARFYGKPADLSYFIGCSGGGRQAFSEAQRFPRDFDGIIAGAPGYNRTIQSFQLVAIAQATHKDPASWIPREKYPVLHRAALYACDALDGVGDGLISDPMRCKFDPAIVQCTGADKPNCLTPAQVQAAKAIYAGIHDPKTGQQLFPGQEPGSELLWGGTSGSPRPLAMSDDLFKYVVFKDPNWDFMTLDINKHLEMAQKIDGGTLSPVSANIKPFVERGGKLLIYHGWADQNISPRSSVNYYGQLVATLGQAQVDESVRLYMVPGMGHCGGGEGPNEFDMLAELGQWRERKVAPAAVIASKTVNGKVVRTRPLCPYPQVPRYMGVGSIDDVRNFVCQMP
jgi:feruloyl esterase